METAGRVLRHRAAGGVRIRPHAFPVIPQARTRRPKAVEFLAAANTMSHGHRAVEATAKCRDAGRIQECTQLEPLTTGLRSCCYCQQPPSTGAIAHAPRHLAPTKSTRRTN